MQDQQGIVLPFDPIERVGIELEDIMGNSIEYYQRRYKQAADLASRANDPAIRRAHAEMAERYREIIDTGDVPDSRRLHRVVVDKIWAR